MRATALLVAAVGACAVANANAWTSRWDYAKRFKTAGVNELECDGKTQPASCCLCNSIVFEIEKRLNNTPNDYDIDVVFRISEKKKKIKFSRSEARILEVLDEVCENMHTQVPSVTKKSLVTETCYAFVGVYEDELTRTFFNDFSPAPDRMCANTIQVCPKDAKKHAEL